ncbi:MAG: AmmeMemoRadiSam system protein A, partial [Candidatus Omnitrophica bacterium]|nr:AmmeMemoRadiSam system protein A [Candidatus Omnitrophota bacterium]
AKNRLRGCIGNIIATQPLYLTVRDMALAAAFEDPRFSPVSREELINIGIEISVLSTLKKISSAAEIVLGEHGVLVKNNYTSGVYLPQVATETGWTKEQFMNSLCGDKAGMEPDAWKKGACEIYIFSAEVFKE